MNEQTGAGSSQASVLFNALFGSYFENHNGYIALTWRAPRESVFHDEFHSDLYFAASRADDLREKKVDTFFAVAPRNRPSRKKASIRDVLTLHIDADGKNKSLERSIKGLNPSALIHSGSKFCFHPYFFLDSPARTPENTKLIEYINKCLALHIGIEPKSTFDTSRILRVPGTFNMKNPNKPRLVEIVEFNPKLRYSLEYFVDRFKLHEKDFRRDYKVVTEERSAYNRGHYLNPDQRAYIDELLDKGLFEASSRNESMMLLI